MADFGDPSTWEMNVDQFIDSGLPKEKPQELLDLQEQNRKQRLLQSLQKIRHNNHTLCCTCLFILSS